MKIEFRVELLDIHYRVLTESNLINSVWTHYPALDWLDDLECDSEYWIEELLDRHLFNIVCHYTVTDEIYTLMLLRWPEIFTTRRSYEQVKVIG